MPGAANPLRPASSDVSNADDAVEDGAQGDRPEAEDEISALGDIGDSFLKRRAVVDVGKFAFRHRHAEKFIQRRPALIDGEFQQLLGGIVRANRLEGRMGGP